MSEFENEWAEHDGDGWLLITVALPPADNHGGFNDRKRGLLLHVLEAWLADNHRVPALLPGTRGRRNTDAVTVGFRQEEAEAALAFRNFCNEIGVGSGLSQSRVFPQPLRAHHAATTFTAGAAHVIGNAIDIVCNLYTPQEVREGRTGLDDEFKSQVRMSPEMRDGVSIPDYLAKMDRAGVERSLLIAVRAGDMAVKGSFEIPYQRVAEVCGLHPTRFSGLAGVDPFRGMQGLRDLEQAVKEFGFVGAHLYPHWFGLPPDHAKYYPYYAKCCELDIPIMMQVGHNLVYSRERRLPSVARPITLDQVAIDFPELRLLGIHIGVPWTDEMISMAWKHENIYIGADAYAPKHWPKQLVHYMNTYGAHKVLFGTDWPVIDPERAMIEIGELGLRDESAQKVLRDNALKVFKLDETAARPATAAPAQRPATPSSATAPRPSGVNNPRDLVVRSDGSIGIKGDA